MNWLYEELWRAQCAFNARLLPRLPPPAEFVAAPGSSDVLDPAWSRLEIPASLCVTVTTCSRPDHCRDLIEALHEALVIAGLVRDAFVVVVEDASDLDYRETRAALQRLFGPRGSYYVATRPVGKSGFWFTHQKLMDIVRELRPQHVVSLQDDVTFEPDFLQRAFEHWNAIDDPRKAVLYLCSIADDERDGRWVRFRRRELERTGVRLTRWFDLQAFLAGAMFFERLHHEVFAPLPGRWRKNPARSSGVGEQFTRRLFGRANTYQVRDTLVYHGGVPSLMNTSARDQRAFDNRPTALRHSGATRGA